MRCTSTSQSMYRPQAGEPPTTSVVQKYLPDGESARALCCAEGNCFSTSLVPPSVRTLKRTPDGAFLPFLVVMLMTPAPPRAPYNAAAAAPLTTSTFSMSLG